MTRQSQTQEQKRIQKLNPTQHLALRILAFSCSDLYAHLHRELESNPFLEAAGDFSLHHYAALTEDFQFGASQGPGAYEDMLQQISCLKLKAAEEKLAKSLLSFLDADGYLRDSEAELLHCLSCKDSELTRALEILQSLEPRGTGARNLQECLLLQLPQSPAFALAGKLLRDHFNDLIKQRRQSICRKLKIRDEELDKAIAQIAVLNPKPWAIYEATAIKYWNPEIEVIRYQDQITAELCENIPSLRFNYELYKEVQNSSDEDSSQASSYVAEHKERADALISALDRRRRTLLRIAQYITSFQSVFFLKNESLKALSRKHLAESLQLSASSISRATRDNALLWQGRAIPFAFFFPSQLSSGQSADTAKRMIRGLIEAENPSAPLSDKQISIQLALSDLTVAVRTVSKYRKALGIPSLRQRCRRKPG